jgi:hypothetical protein
MAKTLREQLAELDSAEVDAAAARVADREPSPQEGEDRGWRAELGEGIGRGMPFGGIGERLEENPARGMGDRTTLGAAKGASFGLMGTIGAMGEEVGEFVGGTNDMSFADRLERNNNAINENSNLGGEMVGAIAGLPRMAVTAAEEGLKRLPMLGQLLMTRGLKGVGARTGAAGTVGATEAVVYGLAEGGTLDEAGADALYGALFGGVLQPTAEGVIGLSRLLGPVFGNASDLRSSEDLVQLMQTAYGDEFTERLFGNNLFDADAIADRMAELGRDDATLTELFPDALIQQVRSLTSSKNQAVAAATRGLSNHVDNMERRAMPEMQERLATVLGGDVRTLRQIENEGRVARQELQPEYDAALDNTARLPSGRVRSLTTSGVNARMLSGLPEDLYGTNRALERRMNSLMKPATNPRGMPTQMTSRELLQLRQELDGVIYSGRFDAAGDMDSVLPVNKAAIRNIIQPMREKVNEMLHEFVPDIQRLDNLYGDEIVNRHAFEAGVEAMRVRDGTDLLDRFVMSAQRTPAQMANFAEGVKARMIEDMQGKTATQVQNYMARATGQGKMELISQILGPDVTMELLQQAQRLSVVRDIAKGVTTQAPSNFSDGGAGLGSLGDYLLMGGALGNQLSLALGAGAGRRQLAAIGAENASGPAAMAGIQDSLLRLPAPQAAAAVNENLMSGVPALLRGLGGFAPVATESEQ